MALVQFTVRLQSMTATTQTVVLDGQRYRFDFRYNKRDDSWYMSLFDANDDPLVLGIALALGLDLLFPYRYKAVPPGPLFVEDLSRTDTECGLDGFDSRCVLLYNTQNEAA